MATKNPILLELDVIVYTLLSDIYKSQSKMCGIKQKLLNHVFEEDELIYKKILDFFDGEQIQKIKHKLSKYVNKIERASIVEDNNDGLDHDCLDNKCLVSHSCLVSHKCLDHEWVEDLIDITPDDSQYIYYCIKCQAKRR